MGTESEREDWESQVRLSWAINQMKSSADEVAQRNLPDRVYFLKIRRGRSYLIKKKGEEKGTRNSQKTAASKVVLTG